MLYLSQFVDTQDYYADTFEYLEGLCIYDENDKCQHITRPPVTHTFEFISQVACEKVRSALNLSGSFITRKKFKRFWEETMSLIVFLSYQRLFLQDLFTAQFRVRNQSAINTMVYFVIDVNIFVSCLRLYSYFDVPRIMFSDLCFAICRWMFWTFL